MTQVANVGVLGVGSWGTALALRLATNGQKVIVWGRDRELLGEIEQRRQNSVYLPGISLPASLRTQYDLSLAVSACEYLVLAIPAVAVRQVLEIIKADLGAQHRGIICTTKGFEKQTNLAMPTLIEQLVPDLPVAYLSGPSFAGEVASELPTAVTMASSDEDFAAAAAALFHSDMFRVYTSSDVVGVTLAGALKNVIAIAAGVADGLTFGMNARAALMTRGLNEIATFARTQGARDQTLYGLAGLGDLVLTCTDDQSRNRRLGLLLAQGKTPDEIEKTLKQAIEGISTARVICELADEVGVEMPICEQVRKLLDGEVDAERAVRNLLSRPPKAET